MALQRLHSGPLHRKKKMLRAYFLEFYFQKSSCFFTTNKRNSGFFFLYYYYYFVSFCFLQLIISFLCCLKRTFSFKVNKNVLLYSYRKVWEISYQKFFHNFPHLFFYNLSFADRFLVRFSIFHYVETLRHAFILKDPRN